MCTQVRLYAEKHLVASLRINEPVTACRFGCYGREEGCLAVVGASGSLTIKMLQRTTKFEPTSGSAGPPPEQDVPLSIPKKTKLYVEQTQREREQATEMHRIFQRDLCTPEPRTMLRHTSPCVQCSVRHRDRGIVCAAGASCGCRRRAPTSR